MATAVLEGWLFDGKSGCLVGYIYGDEQNRWPDGTRIKTSKLKSMSCQPSTMKSGAEMFTQNSSYILGKKKEK